MFRKGRKVTLGSLVIFLALLVVHKQQGVRTQDQWVFKPFRQLKETVIYKDASPMNISHNVTTMQLMYQRRDKLPGFKELLRLVQNRKPQVTLQINGTSIVEDGLFWSHDVEEEIFADDSDRDIDGEISFMQRSVIAGITDQYVGGKGSNYLVYLKDGTKLFARHRTKCLAIAEIATFHMSRLLGMNIVPTSILTLANPTVPQWNDPKVRLRLRSVGLHGDDHVTLSLWMNNFSENVSFPHILLRGDKKIHIQNAMLREMTSQEVAYLAQWTDLVLLDFITLHTDRVTRALRTLDGAIKDPWLLNVKVKNLIRKGRKLWLIDNEATATFSSKITPLTRDLLYHLRLLDSTCVFRRSTVERMLWLRYYGNASASLMTVILDAEPFIKADDIRNCKNDLPFVLDARIDIIFRHIVSCLHEAQVTFVNN
ncbi:four-jointed box protein 1-like [Ptychodera flava]|uniref:four-jointed box protein 1-like n=1 Tax=Ptychodera flava TaxID=63121 RepID=UPI00396A4432